MTTDAAIDLFRKAFWVAAQVSGPALITALVVGVIVGMLQAATQVNEASVSFVVKLLAVGVALGVAGPFIAASLVQYTRVSIASIAEIVH